MATLRARATMTPLDVERWIRTATATLEHSRLLEFTDAGVLHPQTGVVHAGWRDLDGTHPRDGSRYLVTTIDPAGVREEAAIEQLHDDRSRWRERVGRRGGVPRQPLAVAIRHALDDTLEQMHALDVRLAATSPDSMGRQLVCRLVDETVVEAAR